MGINSATELKHYGICDASAAIPVGGEYFLVANDEDEILRLYHRHQSGEAVTEINISGYFPDDADKEKDIEGASMIGDVTYWITSHGRDAKGRYEQSRFYFFANRMWLNHGDIEHEKYGDAYPRLLDDILEAESLKSFHFDDAIKLPPKKKGGFNIEGLSKTPGGQLLIGLRNPIIDGKAVLLQIQNPQDVILKGERCKLERSYLLDLDGLGIRSIEYCDKRSEYLIIAGSFSSDRDYKLFSWNGDGNAKPLFIIELASIIYNPESIVIYPDISDKVHLLSDDGSEKRGKEKCKKLKISDKKKYFRSTWLTLDG